mmetsp:Transcript_30854/g.45135  ORF Transcript_30854/g.45135 Transcript_30854/m.45135 type:complete len:127 (-) Transcript_30854:155-535(-)
MGSYLGSCSGCSIDDQTDTLKCTKCSKACGAQIESSIPFGSCGSKSFGNDGGSLQCDDLPAGNYLRSCESCNKGSDGHLSCSCMGSDGKKIDTRIKLDACANGQFDNTDGQLVCGGGADAGRSAEL